MANPRTTRRLRIDAATIVRLEALAKKDARTLNNRVECILMWAEQRPDLLAELKVAKKKKVGLGEYLGELYELGKELGKR